MNEDPGTSRDQRAVDDSHVNLLSVFHFVGAGLALLGVAFVVLHYTFMHAVMNNAAASAKDPTAALPPGFFDLFRWIYVVLGGWYGWSLVGNVLAGIYLRARKHRTFCFVVAATNCLHMPFGTVLGIFTIVVLGRESVRAAFAPQTFSGYRVE
jgi:hypothetical protein